MFYGRGAGGQPTASAVLGDLVGVARNRVDRRARPGRVVVRRPAGAADGRGAHPLPHQPRRRGPPGRARAGGAGLRRARGVDRDGPAGRCGRPTTAPGRAALVVVTHAAAGRRARRDRRGAGRARTSSRRSRASCGSRASPKEASDGPPVARRDRGVPRPAAVSRGARRSSRSARAARRSTRARTLSERTGCEVWLKFEGVNPTGSFKDRGMTMAISKAAEAGREGRHLRLDRQHLGLGRGLRRPRPA